MPVVVRIVPRIRLRPPIESLREYPHLQIRPHIESRPHRSVEAFHRVAPIRHRHRSLGLRRRPRDDVDHPLDRVRPPDRSPRSPYHLDPIDVVQHQILHIPVHPLIQRCVHAPPVDQHQQPFRKWAVESPNPHRPLVALFLRHLHPRHQPQQIRNRLRPRPLDVLVRQHIHRRRRVPHLFRLFRDRRYLDVAQLLQRHRLQLRRLRLPRPLRHARRCVARGPRQPRPHQRNPDAPGIPHQCVHTPQAGGGRFARVSKSKGAHPSGEGRRGYTATLVLRCRALRSRLCGE